MTPEMVGKIKSLPGPVLVLGAGGFVGANLFRALLAVRDDVYGTVTDPDNARLADINPERLLVGRFERGYRNPLVAGGCSFKTVFNCIAYGGYSWQKDADLIRWTNYELTKSIVEDLACSDIVAYVHAGSSSEYGENVSGPREDNHPTPNSVYAESKAAATTYLQHKGIGGFPCVTLRLFSVYGAFEDPKRLIPTLVEAGLRKAYPPLVNANISRDFVYVDDVVEAFVDAASGLSTGRLTRGDVFNIGTGIATTIGELAAIAKNLFGIPGEPAYTMSARDWDQGGKWYADTAKASSVLGWTARTMLVDGLRKTAGLEP
jgi:dolichol-phosphate mannosyltransferase